MAVSAGLIKELRDQTGAGIMDCKQALAQADGDMEKAQDILRHKGVGKAAKKGDRDTPEGLIGTYIHPGSRIGVMIEVNCETDFVARTEDFQAFVKDLSLQIAGSSPPARYVQQEDMPAEELEKEKALFYEDAKALGKPEKVTEQIVQGKLEKFCAQACLLDQPYIKDTDMRVRDLLSQKIAKLGENIRVRRFIRFELGEEA